jgi:hypothetical protein
MGIKRVSTAEFEPVSCCLDAVLQEAAGPCRSIPSSPARPHARGLPTTATCARILQQALGRQGDHDLPVQGMRPPQAEPENVGCIWRWWVAYEKRSGDGFLETLGIHFEAV